MNDPNAPPSQIKCSWCKDEAKVSITYQNKFCKEDGTGKYTLCFQCEHFFNQINWWHETLKRSLL